MKPAISLMSLMDSYCCLSQITLVLNLRKTSEL